MKKNAEEKSSWKTFNYQEWKKANDRFDHATYKRQCRQIFRKCKKDSTHIFELKNVEPQPPWRPSAYYDRKRDTIDVHLADEPHYVQWVSPQISVLLSVETNELIGIEINKVRRLRRKAI